jgi:uncharacterized Zn finger protein
VNPYFGVYEEPLYETTIEFQPISAAKWSAVIALMAAKASLISRLLLNEIPDNIEATFNQLNLNFLPHSRRDIDTHCTCPDSNPCKHVAGVYYLIAAELDNDPFLLFELRGLPRQKLFKELAKSPLGQALAGEMQLEAQPPQPVESFYPPLETVKTDICKDLHSFWQGNKRLPQTVGILPDVPVSAIPVKKQGDFPRFLEKNNSFVEAMETLYMQIKQKGQL